MSTCSGARVPIGSIVSPEDAQEVAWRAIGISLIRRAESSAGRARTCRATAERREGPFRTEELALEHGILDHRYAVIK